MRAYNWFVVVNSIFLLQSHSGVEYLLVTPGNSLYFPGVDYIRASVSKAATKQGECHLPVIVDCRYVLGNFPFSISNWYI